jgi:acyl-CoA reductase-like NAD-dependent aldehyde dehydrogenase
MNAQPNPDPLLGATASLRTDFAHLIDGELVTGKEWFDVINPATGQAFARAPSLSRAELDRAVAGARRAFPGWRATPVADRRAAIGRMAQILTDNAAALAQLLTEEQGKPASRWDSRVMRSVARPRSRWAWRK